MPSRIEGPLVIRGAIRDWPLFKSLHGKSPEDAADELVEIIGRDSSIRYTALDSSYEGRIGFNHEMNGINYDFNGSEAAAGDIIPRMASSSETLYMQSSPIQQFPSIQSRLSPVRGVAGSPWQTRFWIGTGGHQVPLHVDAERNMVCQVAGEKTFRMFPPEVVKGLYPAPLGRRFYSGVPINSLVDVFAPAYSQFPGYAEVESQGVQATLEPGDVLLFPALWWHSVSSRGFNVMVNCWYDVRGDLMDFLPLMMASLAILGPMGARASEFRPLVVDSVLDPHGSSGRAALKRAPKDIERLLREARAVCRTWSDAERARLLSFLDAWVFDREELDPFPPIAGDPYGEMMRYVSKSATGRARRQRALIRALRPLQLPFHKARNARQARGVITT